MEPCCHAGPLQSSSLWCLPGTAHAKMGLLPALIFAAGPGEGVPRTHPGEGLEASLPSLFFLYRGNPKFLHVHPSPPAPAQPSRSGVTRAMQPTLPGYPWRNMAMGIAAQLGSGTPTSAQPRARWAPAGAGGGKAVVPGQAAAAGRSLPPHRLQPSAVGGRKLPRRQRAK